MRGQLDGLGAGSGRLQGAVCFAFCAMRHTSNLHVLVTAPSRISVSVLVV